MAEAGALTSEVSWGRICKVAAHKARGQIKSGFTVWNIISGLCMVSSAAAFVGYFTDDMVLYNWAASIGAASLLCVLYKIYRIIKNGDYESHII